MILVVPMCQCRCVRIWLYGLVTRPGCRDDETWMYAYGLMLMCVCVYANATACVCIEVGVNIDVDGSAHVVGGEDADACVGGEVDEGAGVRIHMCESRWVWRALFGRLFRSMCGGICVQLALSMCLGVDLRVDGALPGDIAVAASQMDSRARAGGTQREVQVGVGRLWQLQLGAAEPCAA